MTGNEPFFASLGLTVEQPPLPDDVWNRALDVALDPTTAAVDSDLVPDQDDIAAVPPDDDEIVLVDDSQPAADDDTGDGLQDHHTQDHHTDAHDVHDHDVLTHHDIEDGAPAAGDLEAIDDAQHHLDDPADHHTDLGHLDVGDDSF